MYISLFSVACVNWVYNNQETFRRMPGKSLKIILKRYVGVFSGILDYNSVKNYT